MANHRHESRPDTFVSKTHPRREREHGDKKKKRLRDATAEEEKKKRKKKRSTNSEKQQRAQKTQLEPGLFPMRKHHKNNSESQRFSNVLSIISLAKLDAINEKNKHVDRETARDKERKGKHRKR